MPITDPALAVADHATFNFRLPIVLRTAITRLALADDRSEGWIVRQAVVEYAERHPVEASAD